MLHVISRGDRRKPIAGEDVVRSLCLAIVGRAAQVCRVGNGGPEPMILVEMERVWHRDYANHAEATTDITDDTIGFHNSMQLHSKLGNLPPTPSSINWQSNNLSACAK